MGIPRRPIRAELHRFKTKQLTLPMRTIVHQLPVPPKQPRQQPRAPYPRCKKYTRKAHPPDPDRYVFDFACRADRQTIHSHPRNPDSSSWDNSETPLSGAIISEATDASNGYVVVAPPTFATKYFSTAPPPPAIFMPRQQF